MKILVLCYEYPPVGGGGGRVAKQAAEQLAALGHEVRVLTGGFPGLPRHCDEGGLRIHRVWTPRARMDTCSVPEMALHVAGAFFPALALTLKWKPDVIHAHFAVPTGAIAAAVHCVTRKPYVLTAHLGDVPGGVPEQTENLFKWLGIPCRFIWRHAAKSTAVSSFVARLAREAYHAQPVVIPNGVRRGAQPAFHDPSPVRILFVGRFSVQKAPVLAVRAVAKIKTGNWRLDMIGDGPLRADVEDAIGCEKLGQHIHLHGWRSQEDVAELMAQSQILLMTSHQEGLPMAAIEAVNHGMTVVGTNIEGLHDVVRDGKNGALCERSPQALADALEKLIMDSERRRAFREAAWAHAAGFDVVRAARGYEEILTAAAARTAAHREYPDARKPR